MPIKNLIHRFQPTQLYIVLVLSICYFSIQLVLSHITHALTLLMASYHMLCNIFALTGCIVTIKHSKLKKPSGRNDSTTTTTNHSSVGTSSTSENQPQAIVFSCIEEQSLAKSQRLEMKLRNTFGWTRIDILTMLIVFIIMASLSFSLMVEALQTLVHIDHQDTMHLPIPVMILGFVGLFLNGLTYALIGGYTMHQGSFLQITPTGDVVFNRAMSNSGELTLKPDERQLSKTTNDQLTKVDLQEIGRIHYQPKRQGFVEILRDVSSTLFVIVCGFIVYMAQDEEHTAKLIDPVLSIFSCVLLVSLSYPYMKESCLILLQTIPGSIDMEIFERQLVSKFPEIINYHDLHIWQLSAHKYVSTVHIKFQNPKLYAKIIDDVRAFFAEQGVSIITIQPEFQDAKSAPSLECLVQCSTPECAEKVCCRESRNDLCEVSVSSKGETSHKEHQHHHNHEHDSKRNHDHKQSNYCKSNHKHKHSHDQNHDHHKQNGANHSHHNDGSSAKCSSPKISSALGKFKNVFHTSINVSENMDIAKDITEVNSKCQKTVNGGCQLPELREKVKAVADQEMSSSDINTTKFEGSVTEITNAGTATEPKTNITTTEVTKTTEPTESK